MDGEENPVKKLIIFDCDGVLVDSEIIANRIDAEILTQLGYPLTTEECIQRFTGINNQSVKKIIFEDSGLELSENFSESAILQAFENELTPLMMPVLQAVTEANIDRCVGSSSLRKRIIRSLELTNQIQFFKEEHIFTSAQVQKGKPAPDLFLFAASQMGYEPKDCLVIEDSVVGIQAACEADMDVIAFLGGGHAGFEWYKERIQQHNVPIAHNTAEVWTMINRHMKKTA